jgi:hypothetical protein
MAARLDPLLKPFYSSELWGNRLDAIPESRNESQLLDWRIESKKQKEELELFFLGYNDQPAGQQRRRRTFFISTIPRREQYTQQLHYHNLTMAMVDFRFVQLDSEQQQQSCMNVRRLLFVLYIFLLFSPD